MRPSMKLWRSLAAAYSAFFLEVAVGARYINGLNYGRTLHRQKMFKLNFERAFTFDGDRKNLGFHG